MSRKIIPYPCDYKNVASVRRAHRGGNVFVIVLCVLIAFLLGFGAYYATANDYAALKNLRAFAERSMRGPIQPADPAIVPDVPATPVPDAQVTPEPTMPSIPESAAPVLTPAPNPDPAYREGMAQPFDTADLESLPDIIDAASPGVVGILNYQSAARPVVGEPKLTGSGSGFVLTDAGYIVTNQHVVENAQQLKVSLPDGTIVDATLIGSDVMSDVAVLKVEAEGLQALPIGDSDPIRVGEFVLAIGNPISADELYGSVTFGIISAKARQINIDGFSNEYMQTDAAVNPGNSGGPLINMRGEVIGVTSAKYTTAGFDNLGNSISSEGIGFALPINNVMEIVDSLIGEGRIVRPGIGVTITTIDEDAAQQGEIEPGVYVYDVTPGGPSDVAGLKVDDRLIALDGVELDQDGFIDAIRQKTVGDTITFTVQRGTETLEITVTVGDLNEMH